MNQIDTNIAGHLTSEEKELFSILRKVVSLYAPHITLRCAGGWVRDRLMGKESHDIDIMVDKMSGADFARLVVKHIGAEMHVVKANPEASRHLETAGVVIPLPSGKKMDIDFAMARTEVYTDNSRIPEIKEATPQEDAQRRDLTINSLFYNLNTNQVEDFTGMGIKDLITHTIRTPQNPLTTFTEDPLRLYRTIRFSTRYGWQIDPDTYQAMSHPSIKDAIKNKISKERIQEEMTKILQGPNPTQALEIMKDLGLLDDIISGALSGTEYEGKMSPLDMNQNSPWHNLSVWDHTITVINNLLELYPDVEPEKRVVLILSALTHDLGKLYSKVQQDRGDRTSYKGHDVESAKIAALILRYLKFGNNITENVSKMVEHHMYPHMFYENGVENKKSLRKFIRRMGESSLNWIDVFNHAMADAASKDRTKDQTVVDSYMNIRGKLQEALSSMSMDVSKVNIVKPVLNGNEIMQILGIKPGPHMKDITEFVKDLQDENPSISKDETGRLVKEKFENTI